PPGTYRIYVNLFASPDNRPTKASVDAAVLGANQGNATVTPNPIRLANGKNGKITLTWTGLQPGSYIGRLTFAGASARSFVNVLVTSPGIAAVPPVSEDQDFNDSPGDDPAQADNGSKDKGKNIRNEQNKLQTDEP